MLKLKVLENVGDFVKVLVMVEGRENETFKMTVDMSTEWCDIVESEAEWKHKIYERQARVALKKYKGKELPQIIETMWY